MMLAMSLSLSAQDPSITVSISYDTVYLGNPIQISYQYQNTNCQHDQPTFPESWSMRGGPNTSMMTRMVNGKTTNDQTVTYVLTPQEIGRYQLEDVVCGGLVTDRVIVHVVENPDDIQQELPENKLPSPFQRGSLFDLNPSSPAPDMQEKKVDQIKPKRKTFKL